MIKILTFSTLFPNSEQPSHGVFVENRLQHLLTSGEVEAKVVAPIPWFPFKNDVFGSYAAFARADKTGLRKGVEILYPRYPIIPKIGMHWTPDMMYHFVKPVVQRIIDEGYDFDLLDAHYFYPDGVAAARIAREIGKPLVITARGTDLNLIPQYPKARARILEAANQADGIITVCAALAEPLLEMGVAKDKINVLRNGVNLVNFQPKDREAARSKYRVSGKVAVSVGGLIERKGNQFAIEAMVDHPELTFLIAGSGPEEKNLKNQARDLGVDDRVRFLGRIAHDELAELYSAADIMLLCSSREGWANVLLESMACGTPVVATNIWGTGEVVTAPEAGVLVDQRSGIGISEGITKLLTNLPDRQKTRAYAEKFSWDDTTQGQLTLFKKILKL